MSEILKISKPTMKNIADSLRAKTGSEETISPRQMPGVINGIDIEKHEADGLFVGDEFYETGVITDGQYHEEGIIGPGSEYLATGCYGYEDKPYNEMIAMPYGAVDDEGNYHQSGIITTGGMVSETGILDSTGGYYDAGILNPDGEYLNQGIFGGNGTTLSTGVIDAGGDVYSSGLINSDGSYLDSGVIDRHGEAQQNGILDKDGEIHSHGILRENGVYLESGWVSSGGISGKHGVIGSNGYYDWGIVDANGVMTDGQGMLDNTGTYYSSGILDGEHYSSGIYYNNNYYDSGILYNDKFYSFESPDGYDVPSAWKVVRSFNFFKEGISSGDIKDALWFGFLSESECENLINKIREGIASVPEESPYGDDTPSDGE